MAEARQVAGAASNGLVRRRNTGWKFGIRDGVTVVIGEWQGREDDCGWLIGFKIEVEWQRSKG
jgi:hypothetical protein